MLAEALTNGGLFLGMVVISAMIGVFIGVAVDGSVGNRKGKGK